MEMLQSFFDRILPKDPGKRDITIVLLIVVPLIVAGFTYAVLEGGFAEPLPTPTPTVVSTPVN